MTALAIAGMHRTGTSMVAKTLREGGVYLGADADLLRPAPDNPEGFFEHTALVRFNDRLLEACEGAWDHPPACPPLAADDPRVEQLVDDVSPVLRELAAHDPWGWKDPRTSLTARFWLDLLPDVRFVICVRSPLEVALSLKRRNHTSYAHAVALWDAYYRSLLDAVPRERRIVTHYQSFFGEDANEVARLLAFAGCADAAAARDALNPALRHHIVEADPRDAGLGDAVGALYDQLCHEAGVPSPLRHRRAPVGRTLLDELDTLRRDELQQRHLASLERQRDELHARVAEMEAAIARQEEEAPVRDLIADLASTVAALDSRLAAHAAQLDAHTLQLERELATIADDLHANRYGAQHLDRPDASVIAACRDLIRRSVPRTARVLVVSKEDPAELDLYGRATSSFPQDANGRYPGFSLGSDDACIAHLESLRARGHEYLLVPSTSHWWLERFPRFALHLRRHYRVMDVRNAGVLVDLTTAPPAGTRLLTDVIDELAHSTQGPQAVLDWTRLDLGSLLPGRNVFAPPGSREVLDYLDRSVDIVVVDDIDRITEAARVASTAAVVAAIGTNGAPVVVEVHAHRPTDTGAQTIVVRTSAAWAAALRNLLPHGITFATSDEDLESAIDGASAVVLVDDGVLPLPGALEPALALLRESEIGAVAMKLLAADGSLEAAGVVVCADGSTTSIAEGSFDIAAPWHDVVRDVCGGRGITVFSAAAIRSINRTAPIDAATHLAWAADVWRSGSRVVYQPLSVAARLRGVGEAPEWTALESWLDALERRPPRPSATDATSLRRLVALDDVRGSWQ